MKLEFHKKCSEQKNPYCPDCKEKMQTLLFMGTSPDGYVCSKCKVLFSQSLEPLGRVF
jgi:tRNA(Ile2) C34 agmatinyltransferase TiaS